MTNPADYQHVVAQSTLLNEYQKQALLENSDELPVGFKEDMITFVTGFDQRSAARDEEYTKNLKEIIAGYRAKLTTITDIGDDEKHRLFEEVDRLEKAVLTTPTE